jgi:hypothetical protein
MQRPPSGGDDERQTRHVKREQRDAKHRTARKKLQRQPRRRWVQTRLTGFRSVETPKKETSAESSGVIKDEDVKAEMHMAARTKTNAAVAQATRAALWRWFADGEGQDYQSQPRCCCRWHIVERARRRVRNRAGRYVLEHEVEYSERPGMQTERRWLTAEKFEELLDAGKVEDDLAARDGV